MRPVETGCQRGRGAMGPEVAVVIIVILLVLARPVMWFLAAKAGRRLRERRGS